MVRPVQLNSSRRVGEAVGCLGSRADLQLGKVAGRA